MPNPGVTITGISGVVERLAMLSKEYRSAIADGVNHTAINVQTDAKKNAAVDTGRMRSGVKLDAASESDIEARVEATADYSEHVEYGTRNMPAQPFMRPAIEQNLPKHAENIRAAIKRRIG